MNNSMINIKQDKMEISINSKTLQKSTITERTKNYMIGSVSKATQQTASILSSGSYNVILKPEIQDGIKNGIYVWDKTSATVRNAKTGKVVSQIKVEKVSKAFQVLGSSISMIGGEIQMMQIAEELRSINEKLDEINNKIDSMQRAKLTSGLKAISQYMSTGHTPFLDTASSKLEEVACYYKERTDAKLKNKITPSKWHYVPFSSKGQSDDLIEIMRHMGDAIENYSYYIMAAAGADKVFQVISGNMPDAETYINEYSCLKNQIASRMNYYLKAGGYGDFDQIISGHIGKKYLNNKTEYIRNKIKQSSSVIEGYNMMIKGSPIKEIELKLEV